MKPGAFYNKHKLAIITWVYWFLLLYTMAALVWWFVELLEQRSLPGVPQLGIRAAHVGAGQDGVDRVRVERDATGADGTGHQQPYAGVGQAASHVVGGPVQPDKDTSRESTSIVANHLIDELHRAVAHDKLGPIGMVGAKLPGILLVGGVIQIGRAHV